MAIFNIFKKRKKEDKSIMPEDKDKKQEEQAERKDENVNKEESKNKDENTDSADEGTTESESPPQQPEQQEESHEDAKQDEAIITEAINKATAPILQKLAELEEKFSAIKKEPQEADTQMQSKLTELERLYNN